ncbi:unnamed protein product (macronuclear) [Paramecium tetraurelia]|uniref:USP domain-containing protein n=1 Tax=Paramecium tetraurelia TaxID=5888 RepID=A0EAI7_PARTE|nr:uncharacterized protein GSPATT00025037001 [Paramecium tetraurelia]CAK92304.1 unnamed protein product [Paramecium tetraurelia]|eukprot:XP_001459701.1 hypothetical protein (macronuclear) [Paramecium tetraurelia strain d4-2]
MLDAQKKEHIKQLMEITNRSKLLIISILMYFQWDKEKSMDFILNAGEFLSEDLVPQNRRQAAEILLKQEQEEEEEEELQMQVQSHGSMEGDYLQQNKVQTQSQLKSFIKNPEAIEQIDKFDWIQTKNKRINQIRDFLQQIENQEWENMTIIKERQSLLRDRKNEGQNDKLQLRIHKSAIGIKKNEGTGFFNCIYQLLFQNPELVESILNMPNLINKDDQNSQYINELQYLFCSFIFSNERFVKDSNLLVAANRLNKLIIIDGQINFAQQLENHMEIINKCLQDINKQKQISIFDNSFQSFAGTKKGGQKSIYLKFEQEDRLFHLSLLKQIENLQALQQQQPFKTYWAFQINRRDKEYQNGQNNNVDYWLSQKIDLEILFHSAKTDKFIQIFENKLNEETIKEIKKSQQIYNSLHVASSIISEKGVIQEETLQQLKVDKQDKEKYLSKYLPFNMNLIPREENQNSKYSYCLQATVIEIKEENDHLFYIYIYNFHEEQWYRMCDFQVSIVSEDLVLNDTRKNGCFLVYVQQQQIQKLRGYQQIISEIVRKVTINQGVISREILQGNPLLNGLNPSHLERIQNTNRANIKLLDDELNSEFNN